MTKTIRGFIILAFLLGVILGSFLQKTKYEYIYVKPNLDDISINDPKLINAIIKVESNGNPKAVSHKEAYGLMQVHYASWKKQLKQFGIYHKNDLFNAEKNLLAGKYVLAKHYEEEKGDLKKTLQKYSGGAAGYYEKVIVQYLKEE